MVSMKIKAKASSKVCSLNEEVLNLGLGRDHYKTCYCFDWKDWNLQSGKHYSN